MASRFAIYSNFKISNIVYEISYIIYDISYVVYEISNKTYEIPRNQVQPTILNVGYQVRKLAVVIL